MFAGLQIHMNCSTFAMHLLELIFGILKNHFCIPLIPSEYDMDTQA